MRIVCYYGIFFRILGRARSTQTARQFLTRAAVKESNVMALSDSNFSSGPPREILQSGTKLLWRPGVRLRLLSKLRISGQ